jgi:hypothetical protein
MPLDPQRGALPARDQPGDHRQDEEQDADPADVGEPQTPAGRGQGDARRDERATPSGEDVPKACHVLVSVLVSG